MSYQKGNFVSGGNVEEMIYNDNSGSAISSVNDIEEIVRLLTELKDALSEKDKPKLKSFKKTLAGNGLKFLSDTAAATLAALITKALGA